MAVEYQLHGERNSDIFRFQLHWETLEDPKLASFYGVYASKMEKLCACDTWRTDSGYPERMGNIIYIITFPESKQNRAKCPQVFNPNPNEDKNFPFLVIHSLSESEIDVTHGQVVTHTRFLCSAFTHPSAHKHHEHTTGVASYFMLRRPGSSWGFGALLKGLISIVVLKVERERCTFTPPTYNSCQLETRTRNLSITSPTL